MKKNQVYSWRLAPDTKTALENEARRGGQTLAALLDGIARDWLDARRRRRGGDAAEQTRLHAVASRTLGTISGGDPQRATRARGAVRKRLLRRRAR